LEQRARRYGWYARRVQHYAWRVALRSRPFIPRVVRRSLKKLFL
jgi:hypothetical protein